MLSKNQSNQYGNDQALCSSNDFSLIEGLLISHELYISISLHQVVQELAERAEKTDQQQSPYSEFEFTEEGEPTFSTRLSAYNSFAISLLEISSYNNGTARFVIEQDEFSRIIGLYYESAKAERSLLASNSALSVILVALVDLIKHGSQVSLCQECDEYGLVENLVNGMWHPDCC